MKKYFLYVLLALLPLCAGEAAQEDNDSKESISYSYCDAQQQECINICDQANNSNECYTKCDEQYNKCLNPSEDKSDMRE